ncbi:MAG: Fic family protein [Gammaproteobacteria bacterium]|nr:Fic family protein [Gammaproteobacteria bacterium]
MSRLRWRWEEKDFGFRYRAGSGRRAAEHYQGASPGDFYVVPTSQRKLAKSRADELARRAATPQSAVVVANPWNDYHRDWDWIVGPDGILINYAGCLDQDELNRREDEGVARAMELISDLVALAVPARLTVSLVQQVHRELLGEIYPFAGAWRTVELHKGAGPTKWPLPPGGIEPMMGIFDRDVLTRSPVIADDDATVVAFAAEVMGEFIAIHPFREGNGRTAFILGNLILMQNGLLPLDVYDRQRDQTRYFAACEAARVRADYVPLASLISEWEGAAMDRWEAIHGEE